MLEARRTKMKKGLLFPFLSDFFFKRKIKIEESSSRLMDMEIHIPLLEMYYVLHLI